MRKGETYRHKNSKDAEMVVLDINSVGLLTVVWTYGTNQTLTSPIDYVKIKPEDEENWGLVCRQ